MTDTLYRWVKASERNPTEGDLYHVNIRLTGSGLETFPGTCNWYTQWEASDDYEVVEWLEPIPSLNAGSLEQDFKELNRYLDDLCIQSGRGEKDAGHLWIAFGDKFRAFREKVLAGSRPSLDIVDELRKANPYDHSLGYKEMVWDNCCDKLKELLNQKEGK